MPADNNVVSIYKLKRTVGSLSAGTIVLIKEKTENNESDFDGPYLGTTVMIETVSKTAGGKYLTAVCSLDDLESWGYATSD